MHIGGVMFILTSTRISIQLLCALISFCAICFNLHGIKITISEDVADAIKAVEAAEIEQQELEKQVESKNSSLTNEFEGLSNELSVSSTDVYMGLDSLEAEGGQIVGQVFDKETRETLSGVVILIEDTDFATISDSQGRFNFGGVTQGLYVLTFFKDGYLQAKVTDTAVSNQETAVLNFAMPRRPIEISDEVFQLQDFVVTAKEANEFALNLEIIMSSESTLSIMSSEDFSKYATSDIGDAVKRVSGVTVEGGKYASIRGLSDRYVSTTLNGLPIASPDPDRLAVQLDLFPTSLFNSVQVFKTYSVERVSNATGAINLITKPIPEEPFLKISIGTKVNSNVKDGKFLKNNRVNDNDKYADGAKDRQIPFDQIPQTAPLWPHSFAMPDYASSIYITQEQFDQAIIVLETYKDLLGRSNHNYLGDINKFGKSFKIDFGNKHVLSPTLEFGYTGGLNYSSSASHKEGLYFKAATAESDSLSYPLTTENFTDPGKATLYHKAHKTTSDLEYVLSAGLMLGFKINEVHQVNFNYLNLNTALDRRVRVDASQPGYGNILSAQHTSFRSDGDPQNYTGPFPIWVPADPLLNSSNQNLDYQINESIHYIERDLVSKQVIGKSLFDVKNGSLEFNWGLGEDYSAQDEPGFTQTRAIVISENNDLTVSTRSNSPGIPTPQHIIWRYISEDKSNNALSFKFSNKKDSNFKTEAMFGYASTDTFRVSKDSYVSISGPTIDSNNLRELAYIQASDDPGAPLQGLDDLTPIAITEAAYINLNSESEGSFVSIDQELPYSFRVITGIRNETVKSKVMAIDNDGDGQILRLRGAGPDSPIQVSTSGGYEYDKKLPSYSLLWKNRNENLVLRFSKSETVAYPSAREISPYATATFAGSDIDIGNPDLVPSNVDNIDFGFTLKNDNDGSITLNFFKKVVDNRIERIKGIGNGLKSPEQLANEEGMDLEDPDLILPTPNPLELNDYNYFAYSQNLSAGLYTWYNNPAYGVIKGVELELNKDLTQFGLNNFSINFNCTYIDGKIKRMPIEVAAKIKTGVFSVEQDSELIKEYSTRRIMQQPKALANLDVTYDNPNIGIKTSLIYNYTSDILRGTSLASSYDYFDDSYRSLDFVFSKKFKDNLTLKFAAKNITNPLITTSYRGIGENFEQVDITREDYFKGRTYSLSIGYEF